MKFGRLSAHRIDTTVTGLFMAAYYCKRRSCVHSDPCCEYIEGDLRGRFTSVSPRRAPPAGRLALEREGVSAPLVHA